MAEIRCPMCGKPNPEERETCSFCQARLKPLTAPPPAASTIRAGEEPLKKPTSDLERAALGGGESIPAGQEPTKKNTAELEQALPAWLRSLRQGEEDKAAEELAAESADETGLPLPSAAQPAPEEGLPDWLAGLGAQAQEEEEELPDWLAGIRGKIGAETGIPASEEPITHPLVGAETLDRLEGEGSAPPAYEIASGRMEAEIGGPQPSGGEEELPDWLSKLEETGPAEAAPEAAAPAFGESLPDWLSGAGEAAPAEAAPEAAAPAFVMGAEEELPPESAAPVFAMETPDWLSSLRPAEGQTPSAERAGESQAGMAEEEIAPAELPSWVQAMRPVEAVVSEVEIPTTEEEQMTESEGPLAGLRGVLPAVPGLGAVRKPPPYSIKLKVDEAQQRYAAYLEQLVKRENQPRRPTAPPKAGAANLLRWLIALFLFLVVGLPLAGGLRLDGVNQFLTPPDVAAASDVVSALPDNAPVLVAFDYQPALAGELEAAAGPLMQHLFYRGARLTCVSTHPMGPALAEHFVGRLAETQSFQPADRSLNLGYLAGGAAGVFDFLLDPLAYLPPPAEGVPDPRQSVPLSGVQELSDYALLVVLTDDAETGRIWVEQMTALGLRDEVPLVMVVSAQAEPMMRPYYDSHQMDGLVSGLAGARFYEQRVSLPLQTAAPYWSAFSLGLLLIVAILAVGGVWNAVHAWRSRQPAAEEKED
ncbi:MAG: hypothetical protein ABWK53_02905 [Anaerolineales bacterium]